MPDDAAPSRITYDEVTNAAYGEQVAASFTTTQIRGGLIFSGNCPRCDDPMTYPYVSEVYKNLRFWRQRTDYDTDKFPMICRCGEDHPGHPANRKGCGAFWNITVATS